MRSPNDHILLNENGVCRRAINPSLPFLKFDLPRITRGLLGRRPSTQHLHSYWDGTHITMSTAIFAVLYADCHAESAAQRELDS